MVVMMGVGVRRLLSATAGRGGASAAAKNFSRTPTGASPDGRWATMLLTGTPGLLLLLLTVLLRLLPTETGVPLLLLLDC